jgi:aquaporin Z
VSFAFGLTVVTGAYAFGHISERRFNPAITLGVLAARRIEAREAGIHRPRFGQLPSSAPQSSWSSPTASTGSSVSESGLAAILGSFADHSPGGYGWSGGAGVRGR